MKVIILLLQVVAATLLYTDQVQTQYWSPGTWHNPVELAAGISVYELNPFLAGHPERVAPYFTLLKASVAVVPLFLHPDRALLYLIGTIIAEGAATWHNSRILDQAGIPWRWQLGVGIKPRARGAFFVNTEGDDFL